MDPAAYRFGLVCLVSASFFTSLAGILLRLVEAMVEMRMGREQMRRTRK